MPFNKTFGEIVATSKQKLKDSVPFYLGDSESVSVQFDETVGQNGAFVIRDEQNGTDQAVIPVGSTLSGSLESDGQNELTTENLASQLNGDRIIIPDGAGGLKSLSLGENEFPAGDGSGSITSKTVSELSTPVAEKYVANTFEESNLTTGLTDAVISSGSVKLRDTDTSTATRADDNVSTTGAYNWGITINPNADLTGVTVTISGNTDNLPGVEVVDDGGTTLATNTNGPFTAGDEVTVDVNLTSGNQYFILTDDSSEFTNGSTSDNTFPYSSQYVDLTNGAIGASTYDTPYAFKSVTGTASQRVPSGEVTVEWPYPADVYAWDVASFQRTPNTGTVDVYIQEYDGTWSDIAGPISRGDSVAADKANNVRLRVELSRPNTADASPTLDQSSIRWKL